MDLPPMPAQAAGPQPQRGFRLRWYVIVLWPIMTLLFVASALIAPQEVGGNPSFQAGYRVGTLLGGVIVPPLFAFIPALIVFFIARRSTLALNITLLVMFLLLMLVGLMSLAGNALRAAGA